MRLFQSALPVSLTRFNSSIAAGQFLSLMRARAADSESLAAGLESTASAEPATATRSAAVNARIEMRCMRGLLGRWACRGGEPRTRQAVARILLPAMHRRQAGASPADP